MNKKRSAGQVLVVVLLGLAMLAILIPALVTYVRNEANWTVKDRKSTIAFHLAEAGIDRGIWKVKESTSTFNSALTGVVIPNYNFDKAFSDIDGGVYRIRFVPGPGSREITVYAEGKETDNNNVRALKCVVKNQSIPGAIISGGVISYQNDFEAHWGPIMSQANIDIKGNATKMYFPRKYSRQVVTSNTGSYPRDTNGLTPPNTDGKEWWSDYNVPEFPVLDFAAMKAEAINTNTYNVYGCRKAGGTNNSPWTSLKCNSNYLAHNTRHLCNADRHSLSKGGYTWYYDNNLVLSGGAAADGCGIVGNLIVRGDLYIDCGDNYYFTGPIPSDAWMEYTKITKTQGDTVTPNEYPGDNGLRTNRATFQFGNETWANDPAGDEPPYYNTDVGVKGFIYVGGNLYLNGIMDVCGAIWVRNNVVRYPGAGSEPILVFFDDSLVIPTMNVVLKRQSWEETSPSSTTWP